MSHLLDRWFGLQERGTTVRTELLGGATTFATMAYIIVVNPAILHFAGLPIAPSTVATILTAIFGTALMGFYANRPLAVAPYMGENAFLAFGLATLHITMEQRLGAVFISGLAFLLLTVVGLRTWLANSISVSMKHSFGAGIGLFIAFVGLYQSGIIVSAVKGMEAKILLEPAKDLLGNPKVPVKIADLRQTPVLLAIGNFAAIALLMARRVRGAILIGILLTAAAGFLLGVGQAPTEVVALPFVGAYDLSPIAFQLDIVGVLQLTFLPILLTLFLMSFLDTLGTLYAVGDAGGMLDKDGNFPQVEKPMLVDALSCVFSSLVGTSTSGAFVESATGVREGARTGLAALMTAALFAVALFFMPLFQPLQELGYVYGPALIAVGVLMLGSVRKIDFDDITEAVPAFATIVMMVFTYNIANGLTAGLILYPILKAAAGRWREVKLGAVVLGAFSLVYYVFGLPH